MGGDRSRAVGVAAEVAVVAVVVVVGEVVGEVAVVVRTSPSCRGQRGLASSRTPPCACAGAVEEAWGCVAEAGWARWVAPAEGCVAEAAEAAVLQAMEDMRVAMRAVAAPAEWVVAWSEMAVVAVARSRKSDSRLGACHRQRTPPRRCGTRSLLGPNLGNGRSPVARAARSSSLALQH